MPRNVFLILLLFAAGCQQNPPAPPPVVAPAPKTRTVRPAPSNDPIDRKAHLIFTHHARCRMSCRHITEKEIHEVLDEGTINYAKSEPDAKPDPKYALEDVTQEGQHLRVIFAPSHGSLVVITCIELGVEWQCHCN